MTKDKNTYQELDELELYLTIIESTTVTFNPVRSIEFNIIKPFDHSEKSLRYNKGTLIFKNVLFGEISLLNELNEYPEFYRSAILKDSELLKAKTEELRRLGKLLPEGIRHYVLYVDQGNRGDDVHIICEGHELTIDDNPKLLSELIV